jgi:hypothetical protein
MGKLDDLIKLADKYGVNKENAKKVMQDGKTVAIAGAAVATVTAVGVGKFAKKQFDKAKDAFEIEYKTQASIQARKQNLNRRRGNNRG